MSNRIPTPKRPVSATSGKDLGSFRAAHDKSFFVPKRIAEGLKALGDSWEYEGDFIRRCGLSQIDFAAYRDQFVEFFVETGGSKPKRAWAGTKTFANKLREALQ